MESTVWLDSTAAWALSSHVASGLSLLPSHHPHHICKLSPLPPGGQCGATSPCPLCFLLESYFILLTENNALSQENKSLQVSRCGCPEPAPGALPLTGSLSPFLPLTGLWTNCQQQIGKVRRRAGQVARVRLRQARFFWKDFWKGNINILFHI